MNTPLMSLVRSYRRPVALMIGAGVLCVTAFAFAAIDSGDFKTASSVQVTTTNLTIDRPATSVGDLMLAAIAIHGGSSANVSTAPSGWTQIARTDNDANISLVSYWKIDSGSEPSSYQWVIDGQTTAKGGIIKYSGVNQTSPIDASAGNSGLGVTATTSAITTSANNEEVIAVFAVDEGKTNTAGSYFSTSTGMTKKFDVSNTPYGPSISVQDAAQATTGTAASKTAGIGGGNKAKNWVAQQIGIRQATAVVPSSIAFNSESHYGYPPSGVQVNTFSHTVSGDNRVLFVALENDDGPNEPLVSSVTYDGVAMTKVAYVAPTIAYNGSQYLYVLFNPDVGTHDVVVTLTSAKSVSATAVSYTGATNTGSGIAGLDDVQTFRNESASSITGTTTPTHDGDWAITTGAGARNWSAGANINAVRSPGTTLQPQFGDSDGPIANDDPYSMTWNDVGGVADVNLMITASLIPAN